MAKNQVPADFKKIWSDIKSSPALLVTVIIAVLVFIYYVYQSNNGGNAGVGNAPGGQAYYVAYVDDNNPSAGTGNPSGGSTGGSHNPGDSYTGPTGVKHYVATGDQNLTELAKKFGLASWNDIYAIPDNQKLFGKLSSSQAETYKPGRGVSITLPAKATGTF